MVSLRGWTRTPALPKNLQIEITRVKNSLRLKIEQNDDQNAPIKVGRVSNPRGTVAFGDWTVTHALPNSQETKARRVHSFHDV